MLNHIHGMTQMTGQPIESDALLALARIYDVAASSDSDAELFVKSENTQDPLFWSGCFSSERRILSMFRLFEWLLRLPEEAQTLKLYQADKALVASILYPANKGRSFYSCNFSDSNQAEERSVFNETAWLGMLIDCDAAGMKDADILQRLAYRAVRFQRNGTPATAINTGEWIELDARHPFVLLARLRAIFLLEREVVWKSALTDTESAPYSSDERFSVWPFLESTLRQPLIQFYPWAPEREVYVLDPRFGTLATQVYHRCQGATSLFPSAVTNIAEKLLLDISEYASETVKVALVGSIFGLEAQSLACTLRKTLNDKKRIIKLSVVSSCNLEPSATDPTRGASLGQVKLTCAYPDTFDREALLEIAKANDILFLIDPWLLYTQNPNCELEPEFPPDSYMLADNTIRNDVLHFTQRLADRYLLYGSRFGLNLQWLLSEYERAHSSDKHLCVLTSYSTLTDLIPQAHRAQEIRKEMVAPHQYTTLLRYRFPIRKSVENKSVDRSPYFLFRLHQWYKMFDPYLSNVKLNGCITPADELLRNVICKLSIEDGAWRVRMYCKDLDDVTRKILNSLITSRIQYAVRGERLAGVARGYAKKSLVNLLISRSISLRHLLVARSLIYNNSNLIVVDNLEEDPDIASYNESMRGYRNRYSDYLLLCAIDRSNRDNDSLSQVMQLITAFGLDDGLYTIHRLGAESESMLQQGYGFSADVRDFYIRVERQASNILR